MQLMKQAGVVAMPMRTGVQPALRQRAQRTHHDDERLSHTAFVGWAQAVGAHAPRRRPEQRAPGQPRHQRVHERRAGQAGVGAHLAHGAGDAAAHTRRVAVAASAREGQVRPVALGTQRRNGRHTDTRSSEAGRPVLAASQPTKVCAMKAALQRGTAERTTNQKAEK